MTLKVPSLIVILPLKKLARNVSCSMETDFSKLTIVQSHHTNDVIFGKGNGAASWPGNVAFRHIVWKYRQQYTLSRSCDKREIGRAVTQEMKSINGRFLMINPKTGNYHEVSQKRAEDKACQSLRQKNVKEPPGFDLNAMNSRKKWFRSITSNHQTRAQPKDCLSNPMTRASNNTGKRSCPPVQPAVKRSRKLSVSFSLQAPNDLRDHKALRTDFMLDDDTIECNKIIYDDDMSIMTLDHFKVQTTIPFPDESNHSVNGFGDDNSVLVDLKQWPDREDPAF